MKGEAETGAGKDKRLLGFFSPSLLGAKGGHLFYARICWTWGVAFCSMWWHHSAWDPLSEILKESF